MQPVMNSTADPGKKRRIQKEAGIYAYSFAPFIQAHNAGSADCNGLKWYSVTFWKRLTR